MLFRSEVKQVERELLKIGADRKYLIRYFTIAGMLLSFPKDLEKW